jgi:hypothetical protein
VRRALRSNAASATNRIASRMRVPPNRPWSPNRTLRSSNRDTRRSSSSTSESAAMVRCRFPCFASWTCFDRFAAGSSSGGGRAHSETAVDVDASAARSGGIRTSTAAGGIPHRASRMRRLDDGRGAASRTSVCAQRRVRQRR